jgi:hypothetical protein
VRQPAPKTASAGRPKPKAWVPNHESQHHTYPTDLSVASTLRVKVLDWFDWAWQWWRVAMESPVPVSAHALFQASRCCGPQLGTLVVEETVTIIGI